MKLLPFFSFYGGKWRAATRYPKPQHKTIIEPFAGSAGYSIRHHQKEVILLEKDPTIADLWRYLIEANPRDILNLPLVGNNENLNDYDISPAEKSLIGFWLNKGSSRPAKTPSKWMRGGMRPNSYWGEKIRERVASQVDYITHWRVIEGDYSYAPDIEATWFVDPPYIEMGSHYKMSAKMIDFTNLGAWCRAREGQVMVCEAVGATWLPFRYFSTDKGTPGSNRKGKTEEVVWFNTQERRQPALLHEAMGL